MYAYIHISCIVNHNGLLGEVKQLVLTRSSNKVTAFLEFILVVVFLRLHICKHLNQGEISYSF